MGPLITGPWSGIPNLLLTNIFGLAVIATGAYLSEKLGKKYAPFVLVGLLSGLQIMVSFTSSKFVALTVGGVEFFIIAGSLMYPILALGEDYLNEFYGREIAKSAVTAQFIVRALSTIFLIWLIFLPAPSFAEENFTIFKDLMGIVPRVAISSMLGTYIGGLLNVHIFAKLKKKTEGGMLWLRTLVSTIVGLFANAIIFTLLAFAFTVPASALLQMILISATVRIITGFLEIIFLYGMAMLRDKGLILQADEPILVGPVKKDEVVS
ncbi:queuosine precursor transporter [Natronincola ferrireducens]|uniref:Queuosine precursor transporter n=1 Tax=Natronincola ferrireducens TaxID=393762 RepID=A0A1G9G221_9FIRM|nr:queuosine precursor transporter [Natronincola ferrireducens]SDK94714.1 Putative vitamin uptake transporter [Natronincola ferrireducens]